MTAVAVQTSQTVDVTFSEPMGAGVTTRTNYALSGTGKGKLTTNPNSVALISGATYRLTWTSGEMKDGGDITITVSNAQDLAGNVMGTPNAGTHVGGGIGTLPTVTAVVVQSGLTVDVTFSEAMGTGVATATNYTLSGTGKGSLANKPNTAALVSGSTYRLTWTSGEMKNGGDITITVAAMVKDQAGNPMGTPNSGTHTGGGIGTLPTVTIDQAVGQADPTNTAPINFTVVFSEDVTGFEGADVMLSGTAGATAAVVTGGPVTYNVAVSGMTASGTVIVTIAAGVATDAVGNPNQA